MNKMRDDQEFNIHFVRIIEKERSLYDKTMPEYRSKDEHERIWQKISSQVSESVAHCKERWRNLRACLTRHLKQQQSAAPDGTIMHKPYYLAEHMKFLLPYTKSRSGKEPSIKFENTTPAEIKPTTSKVASTVESQVKTSATNEATTYTISTAESDDSNQYVTFVQNSNGELTATVGDTLNEAHLHVDTAEQKPIDPTSTFTSSNNATAGKDMQEIIYEPITAKRIKISTQESDDADLNFFRSLLPDIRLMSASQKRRFKMGIFRLIDNVLSNTEVYS